METLVGGHVDNKAYVLCFLSWIAVIGGIIVGTFEWFVGVVILCIALPIAIGLSVFVFLRRRNRIWIADKGSGFSVRDRNGTKEYQDDDVLGFNLATRKFYSQGLLKTIRYRLDVKLDAAPKPLLLEHYVASGTVSPLAPLLTRLTDQYKSLAIEALASGATVAGKSWRLSAKEFIPDTRFPTQSISLSDLVAVDIFDGKLCVWKRFTDAPCLSIPENSENAYLLQLLLEPTVTENQSSRPVDSSEPGLGRVLFERRAGAFGKTLTLLLLIVSIIAIPIGIASIAVNQEAIVVVLVSIILAVLFALIYWYLLRVEFRCHERGVYQRGLFGDRTLRYDDVESFTYSAVRHFHNGVYAGTALSIQLDPVANKGLKRISYARQVQNADDSLDSLRDFISRVLARKILIQLSETGQAFWTNALTLKSEGLEYKPNGIIGRKEPVLLPYSQFYAFDLQQGYFYVWERGKEKFVVQEPMNTKNFFPGYFALSLLFSSGPANSETSKPAASESEQPEE